jgi:hypothetical protein
MIARACAVASGVIALTAGLLFVAPGTAFANVGLTTLSSDPYTNTTSFHRTEVEPDTFAWGSTMVTAFQQGRFKDAGASGIGWATTTDGGQTWSNGALPGLTTFSTPPGPYDRVSDPSVAYDVAHDVWMISSLALVGTKHTTGRAVVVSTSTDGGLTWNGPTVVATSKHASDYDKDWVVCDDGANSPHQGTCYTEWDDFGKGDLLHVSRSLDGGATWTAAKVPATDVIGGQPVVQPNGVVVMPADTSTEGRVESFVSTDGGKTFKSPHTVSGIKQHRPSGKLRTDALPSADVDAGGTVYVVWQDCKFRAKCRSNDIVMSTSTDGISWTDPIRVPIDAVDSGADHFIPGLAVEPGTSGSTAVLGLAYYFYPVANCSVDTCELEAGFISSIDGGATWGAPTQVLGPLTVSWLPKTSTGFMVGDYISVSFLGGRAYPVYETANAGTCDLGDVMSCDEFTVTPTGGLAAPPHR